MRIILVTGMDFETQPDFLVMMMTQKAQKFQFRTLKVPRMAEKTVRFAVNPKVVPLPLCLVAML